MERSESSLLNNPDGRSASLSIEMSAGARERRFEDQVGGQKRERRIVVAIDYGTSNTKLAYRIDSMESVNVVTPDANPIRGNPAYWPSMISVADERLYFGFRAFEHQLAQLLPSMKMCVAYHFHELLDVQKRHLIRGVRLRGGNTLYAGDLAALYLAWAVEEVHKALRSAGQEIGNQVTYNMGAPLNMVTQTSRTKDAFERMLHRGVQLAGRIHQGIKIADAIELIASVDEIPPEGERRTFVIPETHCAMTGAVLSRRLDPGHYIVVDVGAGTTDIAVFWYCDEADRSVTYYSAQTKSVATDDLDLAIVRVLLAQDAHYRSSNLGRVLSEVRTAKEKSLDGSIDLPIGLRLPPEAVEEALLQPLNQIFRHYTATWFEGFCFFSNSRSQRNSWNPLHVVLIGGGTRIQCVRGALAKPPSAGHVNSVETHDLDYPVPMVEARSSSSDPLEGMGHMLIVLNGLAYHYAEIPQWYEPKRMPPPPAPSDVAADVMIHDW